MGGVHPTKGRIVSRRKKETKGIVPVIITSFLIFSSSFIVSFYFHNTIGPDINTQSFSTFIEAVQPTTTEDLTLLSYSSIEFPDPLSETAMAPMELFIYYKYRVAGNDQIVIVWHWRDDLLSDSIEGWDSIDRVGIAFFMWEADDFDMGGFYEQTIDDLDEFQALQDASFVSYITPPTTTEDVGVQFLSFTGSLPDRLEYFWTPIILVTTLTTITVAASRAWSLVAGLGGAVAGFAIGYGLLIGSAVIASALAGATAGAAVSAWAGPFAVIGAIIGGILGWWWATSQEQEMQVPDEQSPWLVCFNSPLQGYGEIRTRAAYFSVNGITETGGWGETGKYFFDPQLKGDGAYHNMIVWLKAYAPRKIAFQLSSYERDDRLTDIVTFMFGETALSQGAPQSSDASVTYTISLGKGECTWSWAVAPKILSSHLASAAYAMSMNQRDFYDSDYKLVDGLDYYNTGNRYDTTSFVNVGIGLAVNPQVPDWGTKTIDYYQLPVRYAIFGSKYHNVPSETTSFTWEDKTQQCDILKQNPPNRGEYNLDPSQFYYLNFIYDSFTSQVVVTPYIDAISSGSLNIDFAKTQFEKVAINDEIKKSQLASEKAVDLTTVDTVGYTFAYAIYLDPNARTTAIWIPKERQEQSNFLYSAYYPINQALSPEAYCYNNLANLNDEPTNNVYQILNGVPIGLYSTTIYIEAIPEDGIVFSFKGVSSSTMTILDTDIENDYLLKMRIDSKYQSSYVFFPKDSFFPTRISIDINRPSNTIVYTTHNTLLYDSILFEIEQSHDNIFIKIENREKVYIHLINEVTPYEPTSDDDRLVIFSDSFVNKYSYELYSTLITSGTKKIGYGEILKTPDVTLTYDSGKASSAALSFYEDDDFPQLNIRVQIDNKKIVSMNFQGYQVGVNGLKDTILPRYILDITNNGLFDDYFNIELEDSENLPDEYSITLSTNGISLNHGETSSIYLNFVPESSLRSTTNKIECERKSLLIPNSETNQFSTVRVKVSSDTYPEIYQYFYCPIGSYLDNKKENIYSYTSVYTYSEDITNILGIIINETTNYDNSFISIHGILNITSELFLNNTILVFENQYDFCENCPYPDLLITETGSLFLNNSTIYNIWGNKIAIQNNGTINFLGNSSICDSILQSKNDIEVMDKTNLRLLNSGLLFEQSYQYETKLFIQSNSKLVLSPQSYIDSINSYKYKISGGGVKINVFEKAQKYSTIQCDVLCNENVKIAHYGYPDQKEYSVRITNTGDFPELFDLDHSEPSPYWTVQLSASYAYLLPDEYIDVTMTVNSPSNAQRDMKEEILCIARSTTDNDYKNSYPTHTQIKEYCQNPTIFIIPEDITTTPTPIENSIFFTTCIIHNNGSQPKNNLITKLLVNSFLIDVENNIGVEAQSQTLVVFDENCIATSELNSIVIQIVEGIEVIFELEKEIWATTKPTISIFPDYSNGVTLDISDYLIVDSVYSKDIDSNIIETIWNLGDGAIIYGRSVCYQYQNVGFYPVILTVVDEQGLIRQTNFQVEIVSNLYVPTPLIFLGNLSSPSHLLLNDIIFENESIECWGNYSFDLDNDIINYTWNITHIDSMTTDLFYEDHINYTFNDNGSFNISLSIMDTTYNENSTFIILFVYNNPWAIISQSTFNTTVNSTVQLNATNSIVMRGESIINYTWHIWNNSINYSQYYYVNNISVEFSTNCTYYVKLGIEDSQFLESWQYSYIDVVSEEV